MPWLIKKNPTGKHCVYKEGAEGQATGDPLGCHDDRAGAVNQLQALYANEPTAKAVKFAGQSEDVIEGLGMPWGGLINGRDVQHEYFSKNTNFAFEWFAERPLIYQHGLDQPGLEVVGRVKSWEVKDDLGVWVKCQLEKKSKYFEALKKLIGQQALFFSSGAMGHLAKVDKSGEIKTWPWVELTLTPTPANALATLDFATAKAHFKAINVDLPDSLKMGKPQMRAMMAEMASEMGMEMSDDEMAEMMGGLDADMPEDEMRAAMQKKMQARKRMMGEGKAIDIRALSGSYESLIEKLTAAINQPDPFAPADRYAYVKATFSDRFLAELRKNGETTTYACPYRLEPDGTVTLGRIEPVTTDAEAVKATALVPERLAEHTELVTAYTLALAQRTRDLSERRVKEGRVLSMATRKRLTDCMGVMRNATDELATLLDATDPAKAEAKAAIEGLAIEIDLLDFETALLASAG